VVATLGKVLKEREFLKSELQRAGHQSIVLKMKQAASNERDMLKSIKDQIVGKPSAVMQDRAMQTMDVQFAEDNDSDEEDCVPAFAATARIGSSRVATAPSPLAAMKGDLASAFKNIYDADKTVKGKKKAKGGQDWSFMDIDTFTKEVLKQGTTFEAIVGDIKLPKEWQKSLRVPPKAVILPVRKQFV
jgi:hypothetical protein